MSFGWQHYSSVVRCWLPYKYKTRCLEGLNRHSHQIHNNTTKKCERYTCHQIPIWNQLKITSRNNARILCRFTLRIFVVNPSKQRCQKSNLILIRSKLVIGINKSCKNINQMHPNDRSLSMHDQLLQFKSHYSITFALDQF